jgi:hypothetical protein
VITAEYKGMEDADLDSMITTSTDLTASHRFLGFRVSTPQGGAEVAK